MRNKKKSSSKRKKKGQSRFKTISRTLSVVHEVERYDKSFDATCIGEAPLQMFLDELDIQPKNRARKHHGAKTPTNMSRIFEVNLGSDLRSRQSSMSSSLQRDTLRSSTCSFCSHQSAASNSRVSVTTNERGAQRSLSPEILTDARMTMQNHIGSLVRSPRTSDNADSDIDSRKTAQSHSPGPLFRSSPSNLSNNSGGDARNPVRCHSSGTNSPGENHERARGRGSAMNIIIEQNNAIDPTAKQLTPASGATSAPSVTSIAVTPTSTSPAHCALQCANDGFTPYRRPSATADNAAENDKHAGGDVLASHHETCSDAKGIPCADGSAQSLHTTDSRRKLCANQKGNINLSPSDADLNVATSSNDSRFTDAGRAENDEITHESAASSSSTMRSCSFELPRRPLVEPPCERPLFNGPDSRAHSMGDADTRRKGDQVSRLSVPPYVGLGSDSAMGRDFGNCTSRERTSSFILETGLRSRVSQLSGVSGRVTRALTARAINSVRRLFKRYDRVKVTFAPCFIDAQQKPRGPFDNRVSHHTQPKYVVLPRLTPVMARKHAILYFFDVENRATLNGFPALISQINTMEYKSKPFCYMVGVYPSQEDIKVFRSGSTVEDARFLCDAVGAELYHVEPFENEGWATELVTYVLKNAFSKPQTAPTGKGSNGVMATLLSCCYGKKKEPAEMPFD
eukprot:GEMP01015230.1.p1 GENE.GEMP01015230.1~~GEMP01015230.1.p1  ORF type:complete len:683 (+),score=145.24 GEMP01015230.1:132-2180(+)